jgi:hypothetical protein
MVRDFLRWMLALSAAVLVTAVLGSVVGAQFNLARLTALGAEIPLSTRIAVSGHDIMSFGPLFAGMVALGFLIAFAVASLLSAWWPRRRGLLFPLAGATAIAAILGLMALALPVTAISAARGWGGILAFCLCGAVGGWVHLMLRRQLGRRP